MYWTEINRTPSAPAVSEISQAQSSLV